MYKIVMYWCRLILITGFHSVLSHVLDASTASGCSPMGLMTVNVTYELDPSHTPKKFIQTFDLSKDGRVVGNCSADNTTAVVLHADDASLKFVLLFETNRSNAVDGMADWFLTDVSMFVTKNPDVTDVQKTSLNINTKRGGGESSAARKRDTLVFETPVYDSRCHKSKDVMFHSKQAYASLAFSQVRFQPYQEYAGIRANKPGYICPQDLTPPPAYNKHGEYLVPIILGLSLTIVIILLFTGYLVHKKVEAMGYTTME